MVLSVKVSDSNPFNPIDTEFYPLYHILFLFIYLFIFYFLIVAIMERRGLEP